MDVRWLGKPSTSDGDGTMALPAQGIPRSQASPASSEINTELSERTPRCFWSNPTIILLRSFKYKLHINISYLYLYLYLMYIIHIYIYILCSQYRQVFHTILFLVPLAISPQARHLCPCWTCLCLCLGRARCLRGCQGKRAIIMA